MHVKGFGVADIVRTPDAVDELTPGEHPAGIAHQILEQVEFLEWQGDRLAVDRHGVSVDIHPDGPGLQYHHGAVVVGRLTAAAQHRTDPGDEFARRIRFGDIVVGAEFEADHLVDLRIAGGHHNHRNPGPRAQGPADLGTRHPRQHHVEQYDIGIDPLECGERLRAVVDHAGLETFLAQQECQRIGQGFLVLDDQYVRHR